MVRADHPSNNKRGGVCIYFKQSLPLIRRGDLSTMQEAIMTEISEKNETYFFTCFYRSPSQSHDKFENFCSELRGCLRGCLNVKFIPRWNSWWNHPFLWWNVSYCLHVFAETKFHPRMNSSRDERQGWHFIPGWKKEKKTCKHFIPGWNFKMSMFF